MSFSPIQRGRQGRQLMRSTAPQKRRAFFAFSQNWAKRSAGSPRRTRPCRTMREVRGLRELRETWRWVAAPSGHFRRLQYRRGHRPLHRRRPIRNRCLLRAGPSFWPWATPLRASGRRPPTCSAWPSSGTPRRPLLLRQTSSSLDTGTAPIRPSRSFLFFSLL